MKYEAQIAVVGGGASGLSAAVAAAEAGASVIVLEANATVGGNGLFPRGVFAVDSVVQRRKLVFADADEMFRLCMDYSHWKLDARIVRALIDKSGDTISWLMEKGVEFVDVVHHTPNQTPEVFHITKTEENAGRAVINALKARALELGVNILTRTRAKELIIAPDGSICGVNCEDCQVGAGKVIICSGGFAGNSELVSKFFPKYADKITHGAGMAHKGDGLLMAVEAGADIEGNFAMEMAAPKVKGHAPLNLLIGKPQNVWVNSFGRRFADEGIVYDFTSAAGACIRQPDSQSWVIFDKAIMEKNLSDGRDPIELIHIPLDAEDRLDDALKAACKDGTMCISDDLREVAAFIGCDEQALLSELEQYNCFCEKNRDPIFAKAQRNLVPLKNPPYYAVKAGVDMLITHGGIRVNERFEVLNSGRLPIKNLYAAGVDFGGADADVYDMSMSGHGFGFAINSGRIAGENASARV